MPDPTRRRVLQLSGAAIAAGCAGAGRAPRVGRTDADVAVIGGGLAGLVAARDLAAGGARVVLLEAADQVGGRVRNQAVAGAPVEAGGQWVGPTQTAVLGLCDELGLGTFPTFDTGDTVVSWQGMRITGRGDFLEPDEREDLARATAELERLAAEVPIEAPWTARDAAARDAQTVASWLDGAVTTAGARISLESGLASTIGGAATETSLLWFLYYIASAGGLAALESIAGGAQERRIAGGSQALALALASGLGDSIRLATPVRRIVDTAGAPVRIELDGGALTADRVVVAMSPIDAARIAPARAPLGGAWRMAGGFKAHVGYEKPFWRDAGLSGQAVTDGVVEMTFDNSPPDGGPGILLVFADRARLPDDPAARRGAVIAAMVPLFGKAAEDAIDYVDQDWSAERFVAGCVSPLPPGVLTGHGASLRAPAGRIHWAGTETSAIWNGYMDGAVRSGQRVAAEILTDG